jgi:hypothetical protein
MKVKINGNLYEVTKNGKPLTGKMAEYETFLVFAPRCFRYVAVASFPSSIRKGDVLRAVTFAADMPYIDTVIEAVEKKWPKSAKSRFSRVLGSRVPTRSKPKGR